MANIRKKAPIEYDGKVFQHKCSFYEYYKKKHGKENCYSLVVFKERMREGLGHLFAIKRLPKSLRPKQTRQRYGISQPITDKEMQINIKRIVARNKNQYTDLSFQEQKLEEVIKELRG